MVLTAADVQARHTATARAEVGTNATVVAVTVLDPGSGCVTPPDVVLGGGGSSNAVVKASHRLPDPAESA
jgi:hypothetical protein